MMAAANVKIRSWMQFLVKLLCAAYLLLTSLYCLLAFLPYTYYALIKAPAYAWMPWFANHHGGIYWVLLAGMIAAYWPARRSWWYISSFAALAAAGFYILARPFVAEIKSDFHAYAWSAAALAPLLLMALAELKAVWPRLACPRPLGYFPAVCSAVAVASLSLLATRLHALSHTSGAELKLASFEIGFWVVITHAVLALIAVSGLNVIFAMAEKSRVPRALSYGTLLLALVIALHFAVAGFLDSAFNFAGWPAQLYAALLSASIVLVGFWLAAFFHQEIGTLWERVRESKVRRMAVAPPLAVVAGASVFLMPWIAGWDWNELFQHVLTVAIWLAFVCCFYLLWPRSRPYSAPAILAVLFVTIAGYKGLQATEIFWARPLGATNDEVDGRLERYASQNVSFELAHHLLANAPGAAECGELCRILRQHTNVRDANTTAQVSLAGPLVPATGERPNIFVIVVDSLRQDYVGAYNSKVDFTPNIDALANESAVFHNAYTQYAGTTLSEPAIWSGAMLLHAHYLRPFANVNSLEKLVNVDGYSTIVSFDTVLQEILSPADHLTRLDTGKPWNQVEFCSTLEQLDRSLDGRGPSAGPIFFYAQPMNVHQFTASRKATAEKTEFYRPGFSPKVAREVHEVDECMGRFVALLKAHNLYENSIIVLTADHGDALGEFGRRSHSYLIYPEIMRVPLIVRLPRTMRNKVVYDPNALASLIDITPSLYYLLGHGPIEANPIYGHSLFAKKREELESHRRHELFFASDEVAVYGLLEDDGKRLYTTYDSPARSYLFDLERDPHAEHSLLTADVKKQYDQRIIDYLHLIADYYGYKPGMRALLSSAQ